MWMESSVVIHCASEDASRDVDETSVYYGLIFGGSETSFLMLLQTKRALCMFLKTNEFASHNILILEFM